MSGNQARTRRYVLAERPPTQSGPLPAGALRLEEDVPVPPLAPGQVLVDVEWISMDPATRRWMNDALGDDPSSPVPVPAPVLVGSLGAGTVSASADPGFGIGDRVSGWLGWQEHAVADGAGLRRVPDGVPLSASLNVLGIAGQTAWLGMHDIGRPRPGETVVVTAAAGSVGAVAVQLAVAAGARVIGIAGTPAKCAWVRELGAEDCIDYRAEDVSAACGRLCPAGIDVIFDNVGGAILDALLPHTALNARAVLCGAISRYEGGRGPVPLANWLYVLYNRVRMEGYMRRDHEDRFDEIEADLLPRLRDGSLLSREQVVEGLDAAPEALSMLFTGANTGKLVVHVPGR
jgi:NADPH-dependent curcumin reductase CurA